MDAPQRRQCLDSRQLRSAQPVPGHSRQTWALYRQCSRRAPSSFSTKRTQHMHHQRHAGSTDKAHQMLNSLAQACPEVRPRAKKRSLKDWCTSSNVTCHKKLRVLNFKLRKTTGLITSSHLELMPVRICGSSGGASSSRVVVLSAVTPCSDDDMEMARCFMRVAVASKLFLC